MELSIRLRAAANLVTAGNTLADIGTDHAYIPICLVREGKIPSAVAMDVNQGPLDGALANVRQEGLEHRISLRLSDGFDALKENECDTAVLAGMGGALMIRILTEGERKVTALKECILQPQSEIEKVRAFLLEKGFQFLREDMVKDNGKYYPMMKVCPPVRYKREGEEADIPRWGKTELRYGKLLLEGRNPVLREFLERELSIKTEIHDKLKDLTGNRGQERLTELEDELACVRKGLEYYALQ